jgi:transglutaminase-like putative cysteine protease
VRSNLGKTAITRWIDWPIWLLQIGLVSLVSLRLDATHWTANLGLLVNLVLYGYTLGTLAGNAAIKKKYAIGIGITYGILAVFFFLGQIFLPDGFWSEKIPAVLNRIQISLLVLQDGARLDDPILFVFLATAVLWLLSYFSASQFSRTGEVWINLVGCALLFLLIDRFDQFAEHRTVFFMAWMGLTLILLARATLKDQQRRWKLSRSIQDVNLIGDLTRASWLVILGALILVWVVPVAVSPQGPIVKLWRSLTSPFDEFQQQASNVFAPLENRSNIRADFSNRYLALGLKANQETTPALTIRVDQSVDPEHRFYWRARTYDTYLTGYWSNSKSSSFPYSAQIEPEIQQFSLSREPYHFSVHVDMEQLTDIYTEQQPVNVQLEARVYARPLPDGKLDLTRLQAEVPLVQGGRYEFDSLKSTATIDELQLTGSTYPEWITATYLQVPSDMKQKLKTLADEITAGVTAPYEKTVLITRYLRQNYLYQPELLPASSPGDPVERFLFTTKQGFCTYFASAEVLLLRSAGVPARIVVGFNQGEPDSTGREYKVQMKDLHTWPEVYFSEYGWIPFEPTVLYEPVLLPPEANPSDEEARQEMLDRRNRTRGTPEFLPTGAPTDNSFSNQTGLAGKQSTILVSLSILILVCLLGLAIYLARRRMNLVTWAFPIWLETTLQKSGKKVPGWIRSLSNYSRSSEIRRAYLRVSAAFTLLDVQFNPADSPRMRHATWCKVYPAIEADSKVLLDYYEHDQFSPESVPPDLAIQSSRMMVDSILREKLRRFAQGISTQLR